MTNNIKTNWLRIICIIGIVLLGINEMDAQRQRTRERGDSRRKVEEKPQLMDKLNFEIKLGNLGFGSSFVLDLKPSVGYKVLDFASAGVGLRNRYAFYNIPGAKDESFNSFGGFGYVKGRISNSFYVQGEMHAFRVVDYFSPKADLLIYPTIGAGYINGGDRWKYGIEALIIANEAAREKIGNVLEWWINFSYNF